MPGAFLVRRPLRDSTQCVCSIHGTTGRTVLDPTGTATASSGTARTRGMHNPAQPPAHRVYSLLPKVEHQNAQSVQLTHDVFVVVMFIKSDHVLLYRVRLPIHAVVRCIAGPHLASGEDCLSRRQPFSSAARRHRVCFIAVPTLSTAVYTPPQQLDCKMYSPYCIMVWYFCVALFVTTDRACIVLG